ncbi:protein kinase domain-containing protein [Ditylenchus destructor]|uniref:Protein kinase domain-containing protein n=1 Tax=Ditylenchus destructor TaxID=166010 RepID=A0AAD4MJU4_9BILA|nr:protein kinase domain-containing protein [Ditylenchus destructor]
MIKSRLHPSEFVFNVGSSESPEHTWDEEDFKDKEKIGEGTYGEVWRVVWEESNDTLALKEMKKEKMMKTGSKEIDSKKKKRAENELYALEKMKANPLFTRLYGWFESTESLYILMEYAPYDLYNLSESIADSKAFNKERKQHCVGCVMTFEQMHAFGLAYCDLKDENILIDAEGRIKISDFGFVWKVKEDGKATVPVGTLEFFAPELVKKTQDRTAPGFDEKVDMWALGALAFSLRTGRTPFGTEKNKAALFRNIVNNGNAFTVKYTGFSGPLTDLIKNCLLVNDPEKRYSAADLKDPEKVPFFKDVDWASIAANNYEPAFVPKKNEERNRMQYCYKYQGEEKCIDKFIEKISKK